MNQAAKTYATGPLEGFYLPSEREPPKGVKLQILTEGGVVITAQWYEGAIAWDYLLRMRPAVKEALYQRYISKISKRDDHEPETETKSAP